MRLFIACALLALAPGFPHPFGAPAPAAKPAVAPAPPEKRAERKVSAIANLAYLVFLPEGYRQAQTRWPLIFFLHGAGESGNNLVKVKIHGPPKIAETNSAFPFIVVAPQSPGRGWNPDTLNALLDEVIAGYRVDADRVYLTGLSMGAHGTWMLGAAHPEKFAALVPICGRGNPADAKKLAGLPIWVFHGAKDNLVPIKRSEEMVEAIRAAGGNVKFTVYPEAGHDSWKEAYDDPELYRWLLQQKRGGHRP